ncbi:MAG: putative bifunctional diguanylate cyclase/phosphodiesterase, partial [Gammaproteobacteria bacterium]
ILKELGRRLASNTRVTDTVARVGGDEFLLLLDDADETLSRHLVEFLVTSLEEPVTVGEHLVKLKLHTGIAMFPDHCETRQALRRMANIALMTAKEEKSKVVMYAAGQDEQHLRELAIIHDLPSALRNDELYLQYQPKIEMDSQRVTQVEALVRWRHPQLGFIPPDEFIGLLENAGQISQLTDWVFKEAVRQCREWIDAGYDLGIAVNISAQDLLDESLPSRIDALLRHYVVQPSRISIEVTESAVIRDPDRAVSILQEFRRGGLKIALDDFGTGQTSLSLLKQLPLSQVKIDKSFVQTLRADSGDAIIVKSIIDLGHNMGLLVTAEGVESNYCWNLLNSYDCDLVQGYLVSAPLTADELREWYLRLQERHVNKLDYSFIQTAG